MDRNVFWKAALGSLIALALPSSALAATPTSITGPTSIGEGGGKATYTVACGGSDLLLAEVPYTGSLSVSVTPAATEGGDYGAPSPTTVLCSALTPNPTFEVPISDDALDEPGEQFTVTLTGTLTNVSAEPSREVNLSIVTTIVDDDVPVATIAPIVSLFEGAGPAELLVTLSQTPVEPAVINFATEDSSAAAGSDYTATSGQITIPAGQTTGKISVPILDDAAPEKPEGFFVNLTGAANATLDTTKKQGIVAIFDKDEPPVPAFSVPRGVAVTEGNSGTVNLLFPIKLSTSSTETLKVNWRTANFTANTADYESASGTVTFAPGETTKTVSVNVKGDLRDEPAEAFTLILGNPQGGTIAAGNSFGVITDDDGPKVGIGRPVPRGKSLIMLVTCPRTADLCKGRLQARIGKLKAGTVRFELAKGEGRELKLRLTKKARQALAKRARRVKFIATTADASGAVKVTTRRYRVPRRR